jgi:hypothetical protein
MSGPSIAVRALPVMLLAACAAAKPVERSSAPPAMIRRAAPPAPAPRADLYAADEALQDVLSGPLEYVGTGRWPGIERSYACVFRNARVLVVNAYCAPTEPPAFRIDVYSPGRGRVQLYAEANGPISIRDRALYSSFVAETEPPPGSAAHVGALALTMSFDELRRYEQDRYDAYLPGCYAGQQHARPIKGCLGPLASQAEPWAAKNRDFLEHASGAWYEVVRMMRELATQRGKDPQE